MPTLDDFGPSSLLPGRPLVAGELPMDIMTGDDRLSKTIRAARNEKAWQAYEGKLPLVLDADPGGVNDSVRVTLCAWEVDLWTQLVAGKDLEISFANDPGEVFKKIVDSAWPMSKRMPHLQRARLNGGVTGHAFTRVLAPGDGEDLPRVIVPESQKMWFKTDPEDYEKVISYTYEWLFQAPVRGAKVMRHRQVHQRVETPYTDGSTVVSWVIIESEAQNSPDAQFKEISRTPWDFPRSQFSDTPNLLSASPWGQSDLDQGAIDLQTSAERAYSSAARSARYNSDPMWVTKMLDDTAKAAFDARKPGEALHLTADTQSLDLIEFSAAAIGATLDLGDRLIGLYHKLENLPNETELTGAGLAPSSGVSMELRLLNTTMRIEALHRTYGDLVTSTVQTIGMLAGLDEAIWKQDAICAWQTILPDSGTAAGDSATTLSDGASQGGGQVGPDGQPLLGPDGKPLPAKAGAPGTPTPPNAKGLMAILQKRGGAAAPPPSASAPPKK